MKSPINFDNEVEIRTERWMPRGGSLLVGGLVLLIYLFNEDVRQNPTQPMYIIGLLVLCMLFAWRWERLGGGLIILGSFLLFLSLVNLAFGLAGQFISFWILLIIDIGLTLIFTIIGWLFLSVSQHSAASVSAS